MNSYPAGNVIICRFAFLLRELTAVELAKFIAGEGLPASVGVDPTKAFFDYETPVAPVQTLESWRLIHDATGAFHVPLTVTQVGLWYYRGRGEDAEGNPLVATPDRAFRVTRTF